MASLQLKIHIPSCNGPKRANRMAIHFPRHLEDKDDGFQYFFLENLYLISFFCFVV
jgi:hypothetical protein